MSITVNAETEKEIQEWIESGRYSDASAVIEEALQALKDREEAKFVRARELILAGRGSGPGIELTDEVWEEIEREADEAYLRGDESSPRVRP